MTVTAWTARVIAWGRRWSLGQPPSPPGDELVTWLLLRRNAYDPVSLRYRRSPQASPPPSPLHGRHSLLQVIGSRDRVLVELFGVPETEDVRVVAVQRAR
ncbi:hypothetical protein AQJ66_24255 [Streptomyces bungoensis]|uniref:Uncharacterized protein n=1 Tax=Streptomyces bungoensis TaxID=285568 RepID=A0A117RBF3_9ACTN|nr:hypothetical protein AQJ66_24255 [Streptomyces bungoensis]